MRTTQSKREKVMMIAAFFFIAAVLFILFGTSRYDKRKVWPDVKLDFKEEKKEHSHTAGDEYGIKSSGPYFDLPVGEYRLKWQIESDGENAIHLSCSNGARIEPNVLMIPAGSWEGEGVFSVLDPVHNLSIGVEFKSGERIGIRNLRLYSPGYKDRAFTVLLFFALGFGLYVAWRRSLLDNGRGLSLLMITLAALAASLPALREDTLHATDTAFHASRIMNLADALASGQIPARVGGFSYNGWGSVTSIFYPDLFLVPSAILVMMGASITYALNLLVPCSMFFAGCAMAYAAFQMLKDRKAATAAGVLYVLSAYRIQDIYARFMVGEMISAVFIPLFLFGLWSVLWGDETHWPILTIAAVAIFNSHLISTLLCGMLAFCWFLLALPVLIRGRRRLIRLGLALLMTALLSLTRIVPLMQCYLLGEYTEVVQFGFADSAISIREALLPFGFVGLALFIGVLVSALSMEKEKDIDVRHMIALFMVTGGLLVLFSTDLIPWNVISVLTHDLVAVIQFPWRFMNLVPACFALCGGYGFACQLRFAGKGVYWLVLAFALLCVSPYLTEKDRGKVEIEFGEGANPYTINPEYLLPGTRINATRSREPLISDGLVLEKYEKQGTEIHAAVQADDEGEIAFPLFAFDGYEVLINGESHPYSKGENNRLCVAFPAETQGKLSIRWKTPLLWRVSDLISLIAAVVFMNTLVRHKKRNPKSKVYE